MIYKNVIDAIENEKRINGWIRIKTIKGGKL